MFGSRIGLPVRLFSLSSIKRYNFTNVILATNLPNRIVRKNYGIYANNVLFRSLSMEKKMNVVINKGGKSAQSASETESQETELYIIKRNMGKAYSERDFQTALKHAVELEDEVVKLYGKSNPLYASCRSNIALMNKMLGYNDAAVRQYTEALQVYEECYGKRHQHYASTLANLGLLFKSMAERSKGLQKVQFLDRAEEALTDALTTRKELLGSSHKETLLSINYLATLQFARNKTIEAEKQLRTAIATAVNTLGKIDLTVALLRNNLGYGLKKIGNYEEALDEYNESLAIRMRLLKDDHADVIVSLNNIAELFETRGQTDEANKYRQRILDLVGIDPNADTETEADEEADAVASAERGSNDEELLSKEALEEERIQAMEAKTFADEEGVSAGDDGNLRTRKLERDSQQQLRGRSAWLQTDRSSSEFVPNWGQNVDKK